MSQTQTLIRGRDDTETAAARFQRRIDELLRLEPELRETMPCPAVSAAIGAPGMSIRKMLATLMEGYGDRVAIAQHDYEVATEANTGRSVMRLLPSFATLTYEQLWARIRRLAARLIGADADAQAFVVILAPSSADHVVADLACVEARAVSVPLPTAVADGQLQAILRDTRPRAMAVSPDLLQKAIDALAATELETTLLVLDYEPRVDAHRAMLAAAAARRDRGEARFDLLLARDVFAADATPAPRGLADAEDDGERLFRIFYTSGSTGSPKGAIYPERLARGLWRPRPTMPTIVFHYQPLNHLSGQGDVMTALVNGGVVYFVRPDLSALDQELALVRPTVVTFVPRVTDMVFQAFKTEVARREAAGASPDAARREAMAHMRNVYMGGRLLQSLVGTAPSAPEVKAFINECFDIDIVDIYGSTETGVLTLNGVVQSPPVERYKLIDVSELGYFTTDRPFPRGELLVKSRALIPGYFANPEATAQVFDEEGFYKTGDIVEQRGELLAYLDRRNNVMKLSQGEFVAVANLETIFSGASRLIEQIYIYGSSDRAYLLAVIVPNAALREAARAGDDALQQCRAQLIEEIGVIARAQELNSYEAPRDFLIELEPFSSDNGLLTDTRKPRRQALKARYGARLEALYQELAERQAAELTALREAAFDLPPLEVLARAVTVSLGVERPLGVADLTFADLGGDSLAAVSFSLLIEEVFGTPIPVGTILSQTTTFADMAARIEAARAGGRRSRPSFAEIHGAGAREIRAADLALDRLLSPAVLAGAPELGEAAIGAPRCVLLTGATGYLGRFLCLEWLERMAREGAGKLICLVRAADAAAARRRLVEALGDADPALIERFETLAAGKLEVLAGDIASPELGLDDDAWRRLAQEVDLIVHPAALVNHILPYEQLFEPNVLGVAELIGLALSVRKKKIAFVSSVAVCAGVGDLGEDDDIRAASPARSLDGGYSAGYGHSKWAGEVLLREANERFGLPVQVFRSDMILAHSRYRGQINVSDVFSRLLFSLAVTGVAPQSFYLPSEAGARPHYDGLPGDFTAQAIAGIAAQPRWPGFETFHVINPHDDGISLDSFVDWMAEDGVQFQRLADYQDWFARFQTALQQLPDHQRPLSSLAVLDQLRAPAPAHPGSFLSADRFIARVAALEIPGGVPRLSQDFLRKCLADLTANGMTLPRRPPAP